MKKTYEEAMHAVQSGVAMEIQKDPHSIEPKHLRVGINSALCDSAAIAHLLIKKGVFTEEEYIEAVTEEANKEVERYEDMLSKMFGTKITLG